MRLNVNSFNEDLNTDDVLSLLITMQENAQFLAEELTDIIKEIKNIDSAKSTYIMNSLHPKKPEDYHTAIDSSLEELIKYYNVTFNSISNSGEVIC